MLRTIYFDNQFCRSAVKIHDKSADDPLFVNLYRIFAEKQIPELAFVGCHFPAKPPGIFQLTVIFWHGHILPSPSSLRSATSPKGRGKGVYSTHYTGTVYRSAPFIRLVNWIVFTKDKRQYLLESVYGERCDRNLDPIASRSLGKYEPNL